MTWFCTPSKKPAAMAQQCIDAWKGMGYKVAIWRDIGDAPVKADLIAWGKYQGYAHACNHLAKEVMRADEAVQWLVFGGDDIWPDPTKQADEIAAECTAHFGGTFGCMQPTGDDWRDHAGRMIERIAGSPWCGREYCQRINGGTGPWWHEYTHCFVDNEMMGVATKYGVFWQRPDITHEHKHWTREKRQMPAYLVTVNSQPHWQKYQKIYMARRAQGFPGSEPLGEFRMSVDATKHHDLSDAYRYEFQ